MNWDLIPRREWPNMNEIRTICPRAEMIQTSFGAELRLNNGTGIIYFL
jgi:hypothetical protein